MTTLAEYNLLPDTVSRYGIRRLLGERLRHEHEARQRPDGRHEFDVSLRSGPIAIHTDKANEQHYEVPAAFFERVLGRHLKYSCCHWDNGATNLDDAEASMLALSAQRAQIEDGQQILELGCGWGSLSLWLAARYPASQILAVSNSASQRRFINRRASEFKLTNVEVITADVNNFHTERRFDRVVSIEMFEHVRNYRELMRRVSAWLNPGGSLFVHVFSHRQLAYPFETDGRNDWMARFFFSGGTMPSADLLPQFQEHLKLERQWQLSGINYQKTAEAWLERLDAGRAEIMPILAGVYGDSHARRWFGRWRLFFLACAELFGHSGGREWGVSHYRFTKSDGQQTP